MLYRQENPFTLFLSNKKTNDPGLHRKAFRMAELARLIPPDLNLSNCIAGFFPDDMVSFNIRRKGNPQAERPVTLLPSSGQQRPIVPGLKKSTTERSLKRTLQEMYTWEEAKNHGFESNNHLYSFLWRFRRSCPFIRENIRHPLKIEGRSDSEIKRAFRDYRRHLLDNLAPGNVFLLPDVEIDFQNPSRNPKPYARRVLILSVYPDRLLIVPFSTNFAFLDRETDILFDPDLSHPGRRLDPNGRPAIENFSYLRFPQRTFLCVACAQSVEIQDFLDAALECLCAVQRDILDAVRGRLKKLSPIRFHS